MSISSLPEGINDISFSVSLEEIYLYITGVILWDFMV
jgi:hypothetical protein